MEALIPQNVSLTCLEVTLLQVDPAGDDDEMWMDTGILEGKIKNLVSTNMHVTLNVCNHSIILIVILKYYY